MTYKQAQAIVAAAIALGHGQAALPDDETIRDTVATSGDATTPADSTSFDILTWGSFFDAALLNTNWDAIAAYLQSHANTAPTIPPAPLPDKPDLTEVLATLSLFVFTGG
jgi:hypothetical protein